MWSLGITALELYKGYPPLARFDAMEVIVRTIQGDAPSFSSYSDVYPSKPSSAFVSWVSAVLKKDPTHRLSASKALAHRWLSNCAEGKEMLVSLLKEVPDLKGEPSSMMEGYSYLHSCFVTNREKPAYIENTNWDFTLRWALSTLCDCSPRSSVSKKEPWLQKFEEVSFKE